MAERAVLARRALTIAGWSAAFTAAIQVENLWIAAAGLEPAWSRRLVLAAAFPFLQLSTVAMACLFGAVAAAASRSRYGRWGALATLVVVHVLVVFDQSAFRLFGEHMSVSQVEGGWRDLAVTLPLLAGSAIRAGRSVFWLDLALLVFVATRFHRALTATPSDATPARWRWRHLALGGTFTLLAWPAERIPDTHHLDEYPLAHLLRSPETAGVVQRGARRSIASLEALRDSSWGDDREAAAALSAAADRLGRTTVHPNIVLIVLESVGSEQLLPGGRFSADTTPVLAALARHAIVFPHVYGVYPATTRAHVALMTGGHAITWGSVSDELTHRLATPTFVSALRDDGYHTGLFAAPDLRFGSLADFYRTMPWDTVTYYLDGKGTLTKDEEIHSWGVNEDAVRPLAVRWAAEAHRDGRPFLLEFHTIATHHPYGTWGDDKGPGTGDDDRARYANALHYTDAALGRLFADLDQRGLLRNTIIAITGDHGEAFARRHPGNWVHRNRLYEENVRNFLVLASPAIDSGPVTSPRIGGHGDVMPTVLHAAGLPAAAVPGQDLLAARYTARIHYFYKDTGPAETGLRDGRWKFIVRRDGTTPQLYDLTTDPDERRNVAADEPGRVAVYRELAADWYVAANYDYTDHLVGWDSLAHRRIDRSNYARLAPPEMRIGHFTGEPGEGFVATPVVRPNDRIYVFDRWGFLPEDLTVEAVIVSPSRQVWTRELVIASDWDTSWFRPPFDRAKEEGQWQVSLWMGSQRLASTSFIVSTAGLRAFGGGPGH
ncbi:MAG: sulfatase-like hydrolase/transferase [Gemmatimonadetes bacterium]|nr:sulfatase-like hydrolase/transferase [Gemmatimonadota bacterium]MBI3504623.1 sulfatase-like hydrolase/transferase [Pseudomonadota bacterium]